MPTTIDRRPPQIVHDLQKRSSEKATTEVTIAYIGGGSRQWAPILMTDLALSAQLKGELRLYDIDRDAAEFNARRGDEIFAHPDSCTRFRVTPVPSLKQALEGADFVVISIEPGPITLRHADLEIPARYGILQPVGDTTGPGGILRALRSAPLFTQFAAAIMEFCPDAWVINYTNPMAICTGALFAEAPEIKAIGCCHEVFGTQKLLAEMVGEWSGVTPPPRQEIALEIAGVNHFTWATSARWGDVDILAELRERMGSPGFFDSHAEAARQAKAEENWFASKGRVAFDLLRRFGALGAAGDRHLVEFVPWYLGSEEELHRWGVLLTPYSWRLKRNTTPLERSDLKTLSPSGEEGVQQIEALLGLRTLVTNVNLPNRGQMDAAPRQLVVETYAEFKKDSVVPLVAPALPDGARSLVQRALDEQQMALTAALHGDLDLAFQAVLAHPLVHLPTDTTWKMFREMVEATEEMLPRR